MTSAVEMGGFGYAPVHPPNPHDVITASRQGKGRIVAALLVTGFVCLALVIAGVFVLLRDVANGIGKGLNLAPLFEGAAAQASSADEIARAHHIWDGALTVGLLNQQHHDVRWLAGDDSVPVSGNKTYVSISVGGDHLVTAINDGVCSYGLTVSSPDDQIIGQDHLPGVGTYWVIAGATNMCSADSAPTSGWEPFDEQLFRNTSG